MKYLLDVNVLLSAIWKVHSRHAEVAAWLNGKPLVVCPLSEPGFLRISTNPKAINVRMSQARALLDEFLRERNVEWIADDLPTLQSSAGNSSEVTDLYLAHLAHAHGLKLATLDRNIARPFVEIIA